ncbi:hypothetical protein C621_0225520 [Bacillus thuringiensis serovar aizawai str. Leapi01]|nr:hypothetical protein C621_0225520 [Bacillus thuringiensis serovar aizawai str. Leapi01]ETE98405.1 hypothetical protein C623_0209285 [Bacillus thuringiensis serovar aizawai str. Hu4-2]QDD84112.1 hypothetical protein FORC087_2815 [Bacillus cereus]
MGNGTKYYVGLQESYKRYKKAFPIWGNTTSML